MAALINAVSLYAAMRQTLSLKHLMTQEHFPKTLGLTMFISGLAGYTTMSFIREQKATARNKSQYTTHLVARSDSKRIPTMIYDTKESNS
mmetsp:Transcript_20480/g.31314  ORF Transcript_20480/g.31314 Transcript_20480/m.31314 type:complete len:90 (-) Transcript_20480:249-518(-)